MVDFAAMRDAMSRLGGDPEKINPICPADLVIDHSVQADVTRRLIIISATGRHSIVFMIQYNSHLVYANIQDRHVYYKVNKSYTVILFYFIAHETMT